MASPNYIPVQRIWSWNVGTNKERAEMIRSHWPRIDEAIICDLFLLTEEGLQDIKNGADYSEVFARPAPPNASKQEQPL